MGYYIDLHIHSCFSDDGELKPIDLVEKCKQTGIQVIAIADHNCVVANESAQKKRSI